MVKASDRRATYWQVSTVFAKDDVALQWMFRRSSQIIITDAAGVVALCTTLMDLCSQREYTSERFAVHDAVKLITDIHLGDAKIASVKALRTKLLASDVISTTSPADWLDQLSRMTPDADVNLFAEFLRRWFFGLQRWESWLRKSLTGEGGSPDGFNAERDKGRKRACGALLMNMRSVPDLMDRYFAPHLHTDGSVKYQDLVAIRNAVQGRDFHAYSAEQAHWTSPPHARAPRPKTQAATVLNSVHKRVSALSAANQAMTVASAEAADTNRAHLRSMQTSVQESLRAQRQLFQDRLDQQAREMQDLQQLLNQQQQTTPTVAAAAVRPPTTACRDFQRGNCRRGGACRFSHDAQPQPGQSSPRPRGKAICYSFRDLGTCRFGDECHFEHGPRGKKRKADDSPPGRGRRMTCFTYADTGSCRFGRHCRYTHESAPARAQPEADKKELCRLFLNGSCNRDSSCPYVHDQAAAGVVAAAIAGSRAHSARGRQQPDKGDNQPAGSSSSDPKSQSN
jgi:hypothetical protein